ncbi:Oidioi.mRNA.OKI2018_I69.PAR.g9500.t2.cds [Oikopleura dioica]|uniref:Oidioi.mRNA.OKI2018_I69.PAR.g9500.t2.cds n=1 Tax=Oikopleura dioica TaxID=34765 RepID=A0ABN7RQE1_OIKDI|nr:Oidioi.mRNA.OKI2018_I69.PAR.g9500.t2.cds [Oikopleura dioica]
MRKTLFLLYFWSFCEAQGRFSPRRINAGGFFHPKRGVKTEKRTWPRISIRLLKRKSSTFHIFPATVANIKSYSITPGRGRVMASQPVQLRGIAPLYIPPREQCSEIEIFNAISSSFSKKRRLVRNQQGPDLKDAFKLK